MSTGSRLAHIKWNWPENIGTYPGDQSLINYIPVTVSKHSVVLTPLDADTRTFLQNRNIPAPSNNGVGAEWTNPSLNANKTITLTRQNPFSQLLTIKFTNNDSLLRSFSGMSAQKCAGELRQSPSSSINISVTSNSSFADYVVYAMVGPIGWNGTPIGPNPTTTAFSGVANGANIGTGAAYQTGNDMINTFTTQYRGYQFPGHSDFDPEVFYTKFYVSSSKFGTSNYTLTLSINAGPSLGDGRSLLRWYGRVYNFDGAAGDTILPFTVQSTVFTDGRARFFGNATLSSSFSLQEQSQSVITGVDKTLQNNFTLSATAKVEHRATVTLTQQTELVGTTFNFRFMDPVSLIGSNTVSSTPAMKRNFSTALVLSTDANANFIGNLIYDIASDYTWDDFSLVGYFVTGYTLRGYATDSSEYAWTDLASDPWDSWTYDSWQGLETGWEQWPEDIWNSTKKISFDFDVNEVSNIIRGGVSQLLSTTALSDNSAKLKIAASTVTADFLCDGSPTGLIGGFSTITQDSILTGLGNYIINNAQNIDGAFNASLLANYIAKFLWSVSSDFSLAVTPTFKPGGVTNAQCITVVNALANAVYGPSKTLQGAFDPEFIARMFVGTDPYLIHKILQETRQIFVDAESRGIQIAQEIRLNSIPAEDRDYLVPQETRSMKLRIPPMTNRFTTPKVRTE